MIDFSTARRTMVDNQLRTYDVTDRAVLASFESVPREAFVAEGLAEIAYLDRELTSRCGSTMPTPMVVGRLLKALEVNAGEKALDVGGAGYGAALLKGLGADVVAVENAAAPARAALAAAGLGDIEVVEGSLSDGAAAKGPFDVILVHGSADVEPQALCRQLKDGGRLAIVMGRGRSGRATIFRRSGDVISRFASFDASAPALADFAAKPTFRF